MRPSQLLRSSIIGSEVAVFLAVAYIVALGSTDPRQSSWLLAALAVVVLAFSWLRRRAFSSGSGD
jgi:MYXO-CTERM domain-containing protein